MRPRARERAPDRAELQQAALAARFESSRSSSSAPSSTTSAAAAALNNASTQQPVTFGGDLDDANGEGEGQQAHLTIGELRAPDDCGTLCFFDRSTGQLVNRLSVSPNVVRLDPDSSLTALML